MLRQSTATQFDLSSVVVPARRKAVALSTQNIVQHLRFLHNPKVRCTVIESIHAQLKEALPRRIKSTVLRKPMAAFYRQLGELYVESLKRLDEVSRHQLLVAGDFIETVLAQDSKSLKTLSLRMSFAKLLEECNDSVQALHHLEEVHTLLPVQCNRGHTFRTLSQRSALQAQCKVQLYGVYLQQKRFEEAQTLFAHSGNYKVGEGKRVALTAAFEKSKVALGHTAAGELYSAVNVSVVAALLYEKLGVWGAYKDSVVTALSLTARLPLESKIILQECLCRLCSHSVDTQTFREMTCIREVLVTAKSYSLAAAISEFRSNLLETYLDKQDLSETDAHCLQSLIFKEQCALFECYLRMDQRYEASSLLRLLRHGLPATPTVEQSTQIFRMRLQMAMCTSEVTNATDASSSRSFTKPVRLYNFALNLVCREDLGCEDIELLTCAAERLYGESEKARSRAKTIASKTFEHLEALLGYTKGAERDALFSLKERLLSFNGDSLDKL